MSNEKILIILGGYRDFFCIFAENTKMTMRMKKGFLLMLMMGAAVACSTLTPAEKAH